MIQTYSCKMNKDPVCKKKEIKCNNITKGSWSGKTNTLLNLINHEQNIHKIFYNSFKNLYEAKYQLLINKRENTGLQYLNNSKTFI